MDVCAYNVCVQAVENVDLYFDIHVCVQRIRMQSIFMSIIVITRAMIYSWCQKHQERADIHLFRLLFCMRMSVSCVCIFLSCLIGLSYWGENSSSPLCTHERFLSSVLFECPFSGTGTLVRTMKNAAHGDWRAHGAECWATPRRPIKKSRAGC